MDRSGPKPHNQTYRRAAALRDARHCGTERTDSVRASPTMVRLSTADAPLP
jgi:hypothetical protein